jgi:hypothetical protein
MPLDGSKKIVVMETKMHEGAARNRERHSRDAWKKVAPKPGEPTTKVVNSKMYHFCPNHKAWCIHTVNQCTLIEGAKDPATDTSNKKKKEADDANRLVMHKAYRAIVYEESDEE